MASLLARQSSIRSSRAAVRRSGRLGAEYEAAGIDDLAVCRLGFSLVPQPGGDGPGQLMARPHGSRVLVAKNPPPPGEYVDQEQLSFGAPALVGDGPRRVHGVS